MSFFSGIEVSKEYSGANAFEVLPEGQYKAMIEEIGLAEYEKIGSYVNAKWVILEGAAENRTVYQKIKCFEDAAARANKVLTFDSLGELTVEQELGSNRGNWSAGIAYAERDIVKDTSNNNVYYCLVAHTSQGSTPLSSNADIAKWSLLIDAEAATNSANQAAASASTAIANAALTTVDAATATTQSGLAQAAATAAALSEANSLTYSQNSLSSATASANSASAASTSETNAAASAASAAASSGGGAVKASTTDTTPGFLDQKFNVGLGLKKEIQNSGANETFTISSNALVLAIALGG